MGEISLSTTMAAGITQVPNDFIDYFLPRANGEYVKLYLYLLRMVSAGKDISLGDIADRLEHTEKDIHRALSYWKKEGLLDLTFAPDGTLTGICFLDLPQAQAAASREPSTFSNTENTEKHSLSKDRMAELSDQTDIQQLLFIASQYVGKPLSPTEISNLLYFYDELHMSTDLIEYLVEYCVSKGSKSPHYMETVAFSWAKEGIRTVSDAKQSTNLYNRNYYKILNAFGIKGRGPGRSEIEFMDRWLNTWHFTIDIISEACSRTIAQIQQPRFEYANRILEDWHKANVHHLSDIQDLDAKHEEKKKKTAAKPKAVTDNKFNNFHQRDYDFEQLERQLLNT